MMEMPSARMVRVTAVGVEINTRSVMSAGLGSVVCPHMSPGPPKPTHV